jgi:hypothetical protein
MTLNDCRRPHHCKSVLSEFLISNAATTRSRGFNSTCRLFLADIQKKLRFHFRVGTQRLASQTQKINRQSSFANSLKAVFTAAFKVFAQISRVLLGKSPEQKQSVEIF